MRSLLAFLLVFTICWGANAQMPTLTFDYITTKEGLPSNDVWCITKDKRGFLWIGTGRSVCRYDGYTFQTVDDQRLGYCSGVSTDSAGTVYAAISTKGLCSINPEMLTVETILRNNYEDDDRTNDMHERVFVDSYNQAWVGDYTAVKRYDLARKKLRMYALSSGNNIHQDATFFEDNQRRLWVISEIGLYYYDRQHDKLICLLGQEAKLANNKRPVRLEMAFQDTKGTIWIGAFDAGLLRFSPPAELPQVDGFGNSSFSFLSKEFANQNVICGQESVDANGRKLLFIGTEKGLSLYYPDENKVYHLPEFYDKGIHVKVMYDDKDNGILWIGTRKGLIKYRYRNPGIHTIDIPASAVRLPVEVTSSLQLADKRFLLGLSHSGALAWQSTTNQFRLWPYPTSTYTHRLQWIQNRPMAFTDKGVFVGNPSTETFSALPIASRLFTSTEFRDGLIDQKGRFWIANMTQGLKVVDLSTNTELKLWPESAGKQLCQNNYIKAITEGNDSKIWVATCPNGLYYFDEPKARFVNIMELPANKGKSLGGLCINAVERGQGGSILVASWGGVNKISSSGQILASFDYQHDKLSDTYCSNICDDKEGNLWFSTNEGIHIANLNTRKIKYLTTIEGLSSNDPVGFLKTSSDELILGHINTINLLNINALLRSKIIPHIALSSVEVKGKMLHQDLTKEIILQPDENSITLNFSTLNFEPASKNVYSYQLEGYEPNWVDLGNQHTVSFTNLPARSYTLHVRSSDSFGLKSKQPLGIHLTIKPYFTNTWLFRTLIGLFIAGLIVLMMRWRVNTLDERNRLDLQITEWRLKALQSQMNPHFLFNSLNSVQSYLLTNRGIEGAKYLSKFSKLVRRIMENSNHQYLSFEQIIDTLRMYVEIEAFRFNHEFSYSFDIEDNDVLLDALLPPMLLQPYVENAIWHGLMPKEGAKTLKITARIQDNHIVCTIEDNGVGRAFAPRTEGHISRGQEMTKGIFESLRRKDKEAQLELIDLFDTDNNPAGTRVKMTIPIEKA
ncbi:sensor histidine kinase [Spirosoma foliorum]|uniref:Histidine kinase n=1 Tax=Spirosoma foliorum TaxID=2710596 RepID=A0A7G5GQE5_9BACT|nr:two-component regulator propeller domain-containing protein [Spirosoma foliorum]QMW01087.1 histidine kinase [Spirosoma foliorum]